VLFGLVPLVSAALCYNLGIVLQATEVRHSDKSLSLNPQLFLGLGRSPLWLTGFVLNLAGWGFQAWALRHLPITVVQPGLVGGFIFMLLFARIFLGERAGLREILAILVLSAGLVLVFIVAPHAGRATRHWLVWLVAVAPLAFFTGLPYFLKAAHKPTKWPLLAVSAGSAFAITGLTTAVFARLLSSRNFWTLALVALGTIVAATAGFLSETSAVQSGSVIKVLPVLTVIDTLIPVLLAPVLFNEGFPRGTLRLFTLILGLGLIVFGAATLTSSPTLASIVESKPD